MYWVTRYYVKENKEAEYQRWLLSDEATQLNAEFEAQTGIRYLNTYWPILGFGDFTCEDWNEVPDWAALDKIRQADAWDKYFQRMFELDFIDGNRPMETRMFRSTTDVRITEPKK